MGDEVRETNITLGEDCGQPAQSGALDTGGAESEIHKTQRLLRYNEEGAVFGVALQRRKEKDVFGVSRTRHEAKDAMCGISQMKEAREPELGSCPSGCGQNSSVEGLEARSHQTFSSNKSSASMDDLSSTVNWSHGKPEAKEAGVSSDAAKGPNRENVQNRSEKRRPRPQTFYMGIGEPCSSSASPLTESIMVVITPPSDPDLFGGTSWSEAADVEEDNHIDTPATFSAGECSTVEKKSEVTKPESECEENYNANEEMEQISPRTSDEEQPLKNNEKLRRRLSEGKVHDAISIFEKESKLAEKNSSKQKGESGNKDGHVPRKGTKEIIEHRNSTVERNSHEVSNQHGRIKNEKISCDQADVGNIENSVAQDVVDTSEENHVDDSGQSKEGRFGKKKFGQILNKLSTKFNITDSGADRGSRRSMKEKRMKSDPADKSQDKQVKDEVNQSVNNTLSYHSSTQDSSSGQWSPVTAQELESPPQRSLSEPIPKPRKSVLTKSGSNSPNWSPSTKRLVALFSGLASDKHAANSEDVCVHSDTQPANSDDVCVSSDNHATNSEDVCVHSDKQPANSDDVCVSSDKHATNSGDACVPQTSSEPAACLTALLNVPDGSTSTQSDVRAQNESDRSQQAVCAESDGEQSSSVLSSITDTDSSNDDLESPGSLSLQSRKPECTVPVSPDSKMDITSQSVSPPQQTPDDQKKEDMPAENTSYSELQSVEAILFVLETTQFVVSRMFETAVPGRTPQLESAGGSLLPPVTSPILKKKTLFRRKVDKQEESIRLGVLNPYMIAHQIVGQAARKISELYPDCQHVFGRSSAERKNPPPPLALKAIREVLGDLAGTNGMQKDLSKKVESIGVQTVDFAAEEGSAVLPHMEMDTKTSHYYDEVFGRLSDAVTLAMPFDGDAAVLQHGAGQEHFSPVPSVESEHTRMLSDEILRTISLQLVVRIVYTMLQTLLNKKSKNEQSCSSRSHQSDDSPPSAVLEIASEDSCENAVHVPSAETKINENSKKLDSQFLKTVSQDIFCVVKKIHDYLVSARQDGFNSTANAWQMSSTGGNDPTNEPVAPGCSGLSTSSHTSTCSDKSDGRTESCQSDVPKPQSPTAEPPVDRQRVNLAESVSPTELLHRKQAEKISHKLFSGNTQSNSSASQAHVSAHDVEEALPDDIDGAPCNTQPKTARWKRHFPQPQTKSASVVRPPSSPDGTDSSVERLFQPMQSGGILRTFSDQSASQPTVDDESSYTDPPPSPRGQQSDVDRRQRGRIFREGVNGVRLVANDGVVMQVGNQPEHVAFLPCGGAGSSQTKHGNERHTAVKQHLTSQSLTITAAKPHVHLGTGLTTASTHPSQRVSKSVLPKRLSLPRSLSEPKLDFYNRTETLEYARPRQRLLNIPDQGNSDWSVTAYYPRQRPVYVITNADSATSDDIDNELYEVEFEARLHQEQVDLVMAIVANCCQQHGHRGTHQRIRDLRRGRPRSAWPEFSDTSSSNVDDCAPSSRGSSEKQSADSSTQTSSSADSPAHVHSNCRHSMSSEDSPAKRSIPSFCTCLSWSDPSDEVSGMSFGTSVDPTLPQNRQSRVDGEARRGWSGRNRPCMACGVDRRQTVSDTPTELLRREMNLFQAEVVDSVRKIRSAMAALCSVMNNEHTLGEKTRERVETLAFQIQALSPSSSQHASTQDSPSVSDILASKIQALSLSSSQEAGMQDSPCVSEDTQELFCMPAPQNRQEQSGTGTGTASRQAMQKRSGTCIEARNIQSDKTPSSDKRQSSMPTSYQNIQSSVIANTHMSVPSQAMHGMHLSYQGLDNMSCLNIMSRDTQSDTFLPSPGRQAQAGVQSHFVPFMDTHSDTQELSQRQTASFKDFHGQSGMHVLSEAARAQSDGPLSTVDAPSDVPTSRSTEVESATQASSQRIKERVGMPRVSKNAHSETSRAPQDTQRDTQDSLPVSSYPDMQENAVVQRLRLMQCDKPTPFQGGQGQSNMLLPISHVQSTEKPSVKPMQSRNIQGQSEMPVLSTNSHGFSDVPTTSKSNSWYNAGMQCSLSPEKLPGMSAPYQLRPGYSCTSPQNAQGYFGLPTSSRSIQPWPSVSEVTRSTRKQTGSQAQSVIDRRSHSYESMSFQNTDGQTGMSAPAVESQTQYFSFTSSQEIMRQFYDFGSSDNMEQQASATSTQSGVDPVSSARLGEEGASGGSVLENSLSENDNFDNGCYLNQEELLDAVGMCAGSSRMVGTCADATEPYPSTGFSSQPDGAIDDFEPVPGASSVEASPRHSNKATSNLCSPETLRELDPHKVSSQSPGVVRLKNSAQTSLTEESEADTSLKQCHEESCLTSYGSSSLFDHVASTPSDGRTRCSTADLEGVDPWQTQKSGREDVEPELSPSNPNLTAISADDSDYHDPQQTQSRQEDFEPELSSSNSSCSAERDFHFTVDVPTDVTGNAQSGQTSAEVEPSLSNSNCSAKRETCSASRRPVGDKENGDSGNKRNTTCPSLKPFLSLTDSNKSIAGSDTRTESGHFCTSLQLKNNNTIKCNKTREAQTAFRLLRSATSQFKNSSSSFFTHGCDFPRATSGTGSGYPGKEARPHERTRRLRRRQTYFSGRASLSASLFGPSTPSIGSNFNSLRLRLNPCSFRAPSAHSRGERSEATWVSSEDCSFQYKESWEDEIQVTRDQNPQRPHASPENQSPVTGAWPLLCDTRDAVQKYDPTVTVEDGQGKATATSISCQTFIDRLSEVCDACVHLSDEEIGHGGLVRSTYLVKPKRSSEQPQENVHEAVEKAVKDLTDSLLLLQTTDDWKTSHNLPVYVTHHRLSDQLRLLEIEQEHSEHQQQQPQLLDDQQWADTDEEREAGQHEVFGDDDVAYVCHGEKQQRYTATDIELYEEPDREIYELSFAFEGLDTEDIEDRFPEEQELVTDEDSIVEELERYVWDDESESGEGEYQEEHFSSHETENNGRTALKQVQQHSTGSIISEEHVGQTLDDSYSAEKVDDLDELLATQENRAILINQSEHDSRILAEFGELTSGISGNSENLEHAHELCENQLHQLAVPAGPPKYSSDDESNFEDCEDCTSEYEHHDQDWEFDDEHCESGESAITVVECPRVVNDNHCNSAEDEDHEELTLSVQSLLAFSEADEHSLSVKTPSVCLSDSEKSHSEELYEDIEDIATELQQELSNNNSISEEFESDCENDSEETDQAGEENPMTPHSHSHEEVCGSTDILEPQEDVCSENTIVVDSGKQIVNTFCDSDITVSSLGMCGNKESQVLIVNKQDKHSYDSSTLQGEAHVSDTFADSDRHLMESSHKAGVNTQDVCIDTEKQNPLNWQCETEECPVTAQNQAHKVLVDGKSTLDEVTVHMSCNSENKELVDESCETGRTVAALTQSLEDLSSDQNISEIRSPLNRSVFSAQPKVECDETSWNQNNYSDVDSQSEKTDDSGEAYVARTDQVVEQSQEELTPGISKDIQETGQPDEQNIPGGTLVAVLHQPQQHSFDSISEKHEACRSTPSISSEKEHPDELQQNESDFDSSSVQEHISQTTKISSKHTHDWQHCDDEPPLVRDVASSGGHRNLSNGSGDQREEESYLTDDTEKLEPLQQCQKSPLIDTESEGMPEFAGSVDSLVQCSEHLEFEIVPFLDTQKPAASVNIVDAAHCGMHTSQQHWDKDTSSEPGSDTNITEVYSGIQVCSNNNSEDSDQESVITQIPVNGDCISDDSSHIVDDDTRLPVGGANMPAIGQQDTQECTVSQCTKMDDGQRKSQPVLFSSSQGSSTSKNATLKRSESPTTKQPTSSIHSSQHDSVSSNMNGMFGVQQQSADEQVHDVNDVTECDHSRGTQQITTDSFNSLDDLNNSWPQLSDVVNKNLEATQISLTTDTAPIAVTCGPIAPFTQLSGGRCQAPSTQLSEGHPGAELNNLSQLPSEQPTKLPGGQQAREETQPLESMEPLSTSSFCGSLAADRSVQESENCSLAGDHSCFWTGDTAGIGPAGCSVTDCRDDLFQEHSHTPPFPSGISGVEITCSTPRSIAPRLNVTAFTEEGDGAEHPTESGGKEGHVQDLDFMLSPGISGSEKSNAGRRLSRASNSSELSVSLSDGDCKLLSDSLDSYRRRMQALEKELSTERQLHSITRTSLSNLEIDHTVLRQQIASLRPRRRAKSEKGTRLKEILARLKLDDV